MRIFSLPLPYDCKHAEIYMLKIKWDIGEGTYLI